jgi:hypothetical protein
MTGITSGIPLSSIVYPVIRTRFLPCVGLFSWIELPICFAMYVIEANQHPPSSVTAPVERLR